MFPHLGAANTPYARNVIPRSIQTAALPDPGLIFDSVFARQQFNPHPNNVSSVFFYWATIIIHGQSGDARGMKQPLTLRARSLPDRSS